MKVNKGMQAFCLLLVMILIGAVFVPAVSAEEVESNYTQSSMDVGKGVTSPENYIPPEYFKDSTTAEPLPESEMINLILSKKTLESYNQEDDLGLFYVPISYLDLKTQFTESEEFTNMYIAKDANSDEAVVLMRMPTDMFNRFLASSKDNYISLPAANFFRSYDNLVDLDSHIKVEGDKLTVNFGENDATMMNKLSSVSSAITTPVLESNTKAGTMSALLTPQGVDTWHNEWAFFTRANTAVNYNYIIGRITPDTWSISGNNDQYYAPQEREIYLNNNRQDAIEIVVNYDHYSEYPVGKVKLFPAIYDDHSDIVDLINYEDSGAGIIELNSATFPHSYGYHVEINNDKYYITFEDMNTLQWFDHYTFDDQDDPSITFTEFSGSSEFYQHSSPITDTFYAVTTPVIDEWIRESGGTWRKPSQVWTPETPTPNENFVHINWFWGGSNNQELITESSVWSGWA